MNWSTRLSTYALIVAIAVSTVSCQTANNNRRATGAVVGTAVGAGAGAVIDKDNPFRGALIGAAAGALLGTGVGHVLQKQKEAFDRIEELETRQQAIVIQQPPQNGEDGQSQRPSQGEQVEALLITVPSEVLFERGSSALSAPGIQKVKDVAKVLTDYPDSDIYVRGYTSSEGDDKTNFELSQRRAEVVKNELSAAGVSISRLYAQGMGSSNPVATNDTEVGRALNRRVELIVVPRT